MGPPAGVCPKPTIKITDWKRVSTELEKVDTHALNNIPYAIETTDEIDSALRALTNHIRTMVKRSSCNIQYMPKELLLPTRLERSQVIGIPMPGKPRNLPASCRPINLLSGLGSPSLRIHNARIPGQYSYKYLGVTLGMNLHFREHIKRVRKTATFYQARLNGMLVLNRDSELPIITKHMKDAFERFFSIAEMHLNLLFSATMSYEAPPSHHFIRRPRNALKDPPDTFIAEQSLNNHCTLVWASARKTILVELERVQRWVLKVIFEKPFRHPIDLLDREGEIISVRELHIYRMCAVQQQNTGVSNSNRYCISSSQCEFRWLTSLHYPTSLSIPLPSFHSNPIDLPVIILHISDFYTRDRHRTGGSSGVWSIYGR
ncbi:hypothetical protein EVAR_83037_1 [Eumeta japonica]|uniref:RNA-directed DNA polymerase from mobile element jockey n=1 Tax=Eumeta variegata TaxID=151549 RepID=A0A4C1VMM3_EUMVA|nr:hypothetical protein EVAR_83037_1 [Eumeta japonica]